MFRRLALGCFAASLLAGQASAQATRPDRPYDATLRTDPAVGNVQGIQRYGRPLRTDPDQGEGYTYHVYPVAQDPNPIVLRLAGEQAQPGIQFRAAEAPGGDDLETELRNWEKQRDDLKKHTILSEAEKKTLANLELAIQHRRDELKNELPGAKAIRGLSIRSASVGGGAHIYSPASYGTGPATPFNPTAGLRTPPGVPPGAHQLTVLRALTAGDPSQGGTTPDDKKPIPITHQPLIQVKMRVVEVSRANSLQFGSVLDFVSSRAGGPTLISGHNINNDKRNVSGGTRFGPDKTNLIDIGTGMGTAALSGPGALVNLTAGNLNYIARMLANELNADMVTAPEVVTLNGQNVEFLSGSKQPFDLGQNVVNGNNNNIQQFFYKHVGTFVSVTPTIVNWGLNGENKGNAPIKEPEIRNWKKLVDWMVTVEWKDKTKVFEDTELGNAANKITKDDDLSLMLSEKVAILNALNKYSRADLKAMDVPLPELGCPPCAIGAEPACGLPCEWRPGDCTIDLAVVVRLSDAGASGLMISRGPNGQADPVMMENNVRGIANIIQLKSGHGAVMAGLIGDRETEAIDKVPLLGDLPLVGFAFRSKSKTRQKTEVLIFIEARVLDPRPALALTQSLDNFRLGRSYVEGEFLDNPLEYGLNRAGMGTYLPPNSLGERVFWERLGRKVRKISTTADDMFE